MVPLHEKLFSAIMTIFLRLCRQ